MATVRDKEGLTYGIASYAANGTAVSGTTALPKGVEIIPVYDRSNLIHNAIETLKRTLTEESIAVATQMIGMAADVSPIADGVMYEPQTV